MTTANDTSASTRYLIERLSDIYTTDTRELSVAWVLVGDIELDDEGYHSTAFEAWVGEQAEEPPLGTYRTVKHESYGSSLVEFEIVETREREIRRVERPEPVSEQVRDDLTTLSKAALSPTVNTQS